MAIGDAYASESQYLAARKQDGAADPMLKTDLQAVSRYLDRRLGQFFTRDASGVARLFRGSGTSKLWIAEDGCPGLATLDDVEILVDEDDDGSFADETALVVADLLSLPLNAALGPEAKPYRAIELTSRSRISYFPFDHLVRITGEWGWPAVPDAIKKACIELTAILRVQSPFATNRYQDMDVVFSTSRDARSILAELRQVYAIPVVL